MSNTIRLNPKPNQSEKYHPELIIHNQHAHIHINDCKSESDEIVETDNCLRVFRIHPGRVEVQVRAHGKLNPYGKAKPKFMYGTTSLNKEQVQLLINDLTLYLNEI